MPVYEYHCDGCGPFTQFRRLSQSGEPAHCPECGLPSAKVFPLIHLRAMRPESRTAWERNERSAHQPHVCGAGCSHGSAKPKPRADPAKRPALESSKKRNRRPWMLGH